MEDIRKALEKTEKDNNFKGDITMERLKEILRGKADPDKLEVVYNDGMIWVDEVTTEPYNSRLIVFPTAEELLEVVVALNNRSEDKNKIVDYLKKCIKGDLNILGSIERVAVCEWNIDELTDEEIDKLNEQDEQGINECIYLDWSEYCFEHGLHPETMKEPYMDECIESGKGTKGDAKSDLSLDRYYKDTAIFLDEDAEDQYWFIRHHEWGVSVDQLLYTLNDEEKELALKELEELEKEREKDKDIWVSAYLSKMPYCKLAATRVIEEILSL